MTRYSRAAVAPNTIVLLPPTPSSPVLVGLSSAAVQDGNDDQLISVSREISRGLTADWLQVAWHKGGDPVLLFEDGAPSVQAAAEMQQCARRVALAGGLSDTWFTEECGFGDLMATSIATEQGIVTVTALFRQLGASLCSHAREAGARLLPLVQPFFRLWSQRLRASSHLRGLTAAINKSDIGVVLVNRDAQLLFANTVAETLIAEADGIRRVGQMICGTRLGETLRLQSAIEHVVAAGTTPRVGPAAASPVLALSRKSRRPLMAAVVGCDEAGSGEEDCAVIIYLFDPEENLRPLLEPVCKFYGLTPMETKLTCLLADGLTLADAAHRLHVREQTARSYLKPVFLKTDTNRQAELVWLMLKSLIRTAPGCRTSFI